jgi:hypothetical protein
MYMPEYYEELDKEEKERKMFKGIINWFKGEQSPTLAFTNEGVRDITNEGFGGFMTGENTMNNTARIVPTEDGKFALKNGRQTVATYARARDAVRGAERRGLTVA